MYRSISSIVPTVEIFLSLELEEQARALLVHLQNSSEHAMAEGVIYYNFFMNRADYETRQQEIDQALMEAWQWLKNAGLLIELPSSGGVGSYRISRRAATLDMEEEFSAYVKAGVLKKDHLHPSIATKVYSAFLRGEYETAIFQAFREVEVAVRAKGKFSPTDIGTALMREAFKSAQKGTCGPLTDATAPTAEQEAIANLFAGAIGIFKNPTSHRHVPADAEDAAEIIAFASQLLKVVDKA